MMNLLFIDDDLEDLELFAEVVKTLGADYKFMMTTNGEEVLCLLKKRLVDFVFLDINMPRLDGKAVLRLIRNEHALDGIKICILSTSLTSAEFTLYKKLGANFCLRKPASFDELKNSLHLLVKNGGHELT